jgi:hypothetical protein
MAKATSKGGAPSKAAPKEAAVEPEPEAPEPEVEVAPEPEAEVEGDADRIVAALAEAEAELPVIFVGGCDKLFVDSPRPRYDSKGDYQGQVPGLLLDLQGIGHTRPYWPQRDPDDAAAVERIREVIAQGRADMRKYDIRELAPEAPLPPVAGWEKLSIGSLSEWVAAQLGDDHDANVERVLEYARYERSIPAGPRRAVLAMLDGVVATEAPQGDAFEAEVTLGAAH